MLMVSLARFHSKRSVTIIPNCTIEAVSIDNVQIGHKVALLVGANEFELPVCTKSWRNIGQKSADCPLETLRKTTGTKNTAINDKAAITFFFILFSLLAPTIALNFTAIFTNFNNYFN